MIKSFSLIIGFVVAMSTFGVGIANSAQELIKHSKSEKVRTLSQY